MNNYPSSAVAGGIPLGGALDPQWAAGHGRLAQSIRLEEQGPGRPVALAIGVIAACLAALLLWAALTQVGEVASASGEVTPVGSVQKIQHLEGGIVRSILVREGDQVERGQVLMTLENGSTAPELLQQRTRLAALELQQKQLQALTSGVPGQLTGKEAGFGGLAAAQTELLRDKRRALDSQETVLRRQIAQQRAEYELAAGQARSVHTQIAILQEQIASRQGLVSEGYVARTLLLDQQRELARTQTHLAELEGQMGRARQAVAETEARIGELHARSSLDASQEISKVRAEIAELGAALARAEDRVQRLVVRAPVRGTVKGPLTETLGGVIAPGATVMEIIPSDAALIVEARVQTRDIGFVHPGQSVRVKVATYDYTRFGSIDGSIDTVSATTFQDEKGIPFYRVRVKLAHNYVGKNPASNHVMPGMTVLADIRTGEKSVLAYLLKPMVRVSDEALHER